VDVITTAAEWYQIIIKTYYLQIRD